MTDNDRNARNEETEKLMAYQRDRDLQRRGVKIDEAIQGITDDDRKMLAAVSALLGEHPCGLQATAA